MKLSTSNSRKYSSVNVRIKKIQKENNNFEQAMHIYKRKNSEIISKSINLKIPLIFQYINIISAFLEFTEVFIHELTNLL